MGFPSIAVGVPNSLATLLHFLNYANYVVSQAYFFFLTGGMLHPSSSSSSESYDYLQTTTDSCPSSIKGRLPVVEFADLISSCCDGEPAEPLCAVCLTELEAAHEVRELGNCAHAFHKGCIDKWVDVGNATCPLCRARLLPMGIGSGDMDGLREYS